MTCASAATIGTIAIVLPDANTLTKDPKPVLLAVDGIDPDGGAVTRLATAALPTDSISLTNLGQATVATFRVSGFDDAGAAVVFGQSLPVTLNALDGLTFDLFVQRTGELAPLPSTLGDARGSPILAIIASRYVFATSGSGAAADSTLLYDLGTYTAAASPPALPRRPQSLMAFGTRALLIDAAGATSFQFSDSSYSDVGAPVGTAFVDVAGGATVVATDGSSYGASYLVGATRRSGAPSSAILTLDTSGTIAGASLSSARLGAAATWVEGRGLVVIGGTSTGAGAELLAPGAKLAIPLPYPADASFPEAAVTMDASHVVVVAAADARLFDLGCGSACAAAPWSAPFPVSLVDAQAFALGAADVLVVGNDASGYTHVLRLGAAAVSELPLRNARQNARAIALPIGAIGVVGGSNVVESFVP